MRTCASSARRGVDFSAGGSRLERMEWKIVGCATDLSCVFVPDLMFVICLRVFWERGQLLAMSMKMIKTYPFLFDEGCHCGM
jgi:hypothetical protein